MPIDKTGSAGNPPVQPQYSQDKAGTSTAVSKNIQSVKNEYPTREQTEKLKNQLEKAPGRESLSFKLLYDYSKNRDHYK